MKNYQNACSYLPYELYMKKGNVKISISQPTLPYQGVAGSETTDQKLLIKFDILSKSIDPIKLLEDISKDNCTFIRFLVSFMGKNYETAHILPIYPKIHLHEDGTSEIVAFVNISGSDRQVSYIKSITQGFSPIHMDEFEVYHIDGEPVYINTEYHQDYIVPTMLTRVTLNFGTFIDNTHKHPDSYIINSTNPTITNGFHEHNFFVESIYRGDNSDSIDPTDFDIFEFYQETILPRIDQANTFMTRAYSPFYHWESSFHFDNSYDLSTVTFTIFSRIYKILDIEMGLLNGLQLSPKNHQLYRNHKMKSLIDLLVSNIYNTNDTYSLAIPNINQIRRSIVDCGRKINHSMMEYYRYTPIFDERVFEFVNENRYDPKLDCTIGNCNLSTINNPSFHYKEKLKLVYFIDILEDQYDSINHPSDENYVSWEETIDSFLNTEFIQEFMDYEFIPFKTLCGMFNHKIFPPFFLEKKLHFIPIAIQSNSIRFAVLEEIEEKSGECEKVTDPNPEETKKSSLLSKLFKKGK